MDGGSRRQSSSDGCRNDQARSNRRARWSEAWTHCGACCTGQRCAHARAEEQHPTRGPSATVEGSKRKTEQNSHEVDSQAILLQGRGPSEGGLPGCPRGVPCRRAVDSLAGQTLIYRHSHSAALLWIPKWMRHNTTQPPYSADCEKTRQTPTPGTRALRHPTATRSYRDTNNVRGVMLERPTELLVGTQSLPIDRSRSRLPTQNPVSKYVLYNIAPKNTCTNNYGALYCKVRTLRLDFAPDLLCLPVPVY